VLVVQKKMLVLTHLIASVILAGILYPFIGVMSLWVIIGGVLIDGDHYLFSIMRLKSFSLKKSYWWHRKHGMTPDYERDILHIAHTVELFVVTAIVGLVWEPAFWVLQGMILHILMDFINLFKYNHVDARAISLVGWLKRRSLL